MIIDFHTHIFPPSILGDRDGYVRRDPAFRTLYASPKARLASADDLLASMERCGIDISVALGFGWTSMEDCRRHNDYLLEAAAGAGGRLVPLCVVQAAAADEEVRAEAERCARAGARGLGELRPADQGYALTGPAGDLLAEIALAFDLLLLFHVSEPVGHDYPGKQGLQLSDFTSFVAARPGVRCVGAHWGGGLPFYALMPEVRAALAETWFDTAATRYLYRPEVYATVAGIVGAERILFGSDYPLLGQGACRRDVEGSGLDREGIALALGGNARRLLRLE